VIFIFLYLILMIILFGALAVRGVFLRLLACVICVSNLFYGRLAAKVNGKEWPARELTVTSRHEMNGDNGFQEDIFSENKSNRN